MIENERSVNSESQFPQTSVRAGVATTKGLVAGSGAGTFSRLEFRCPQCFKLYQTDASDIHSGSPQFECQSCHAVFAFDYPPREGRKLQTRTLSMPQVGKLARVESERHKMGASAGLVKNAELKPCPKCQTLNPRGMIDCYKCGVVLANAQMLRKEAETSATKDMDLMLGKGSEKNSDKLADRVGGLPSLMKMWHELLQDYNNMTKHMAFVDRCEDLQALPFALKKYKELKEVQPQDSLAQQMLNSVIIKSLSRQAGHVVGHPSMKWLAQGIKYMRTVPWRNLLRISPLVLSALMVLLGLSRFGTRNLVGVGVALLVLTGGVTYFMKGRLAWEDFWHE